MTSHAWSSSWLRTAGTSTLRVRDGLLESDDDRPHLVGVGRYTGRPLRLVERLDVEVPGSQQRIEPADLVLPNDGDLTFAKVRLDQRSLTTVQTSLHTLDDPVARSLVWGSLWDTARDAEFSPHDYVRVVLANVQGETDPDLVGALLGQARIAAELWAGSAELVARLHEHEVSVATEPGSDLQLAFHRAALATAPGDLDLPTGLPEDEELRWLRLRRLAELGQVSSDELAATYAAEPTSTAQNHLAYASAALPDPAAKSAAWAEITGAADLSTSRARALGQGFWRPGQDDLVADYVERYVADVPGIWRRRSPELAAVLTGSAFPSTIVSPSVVERTAVLTSTDSDAGQRRVVLECRDDLARAVACRALTW